MLCSYFFSWEKSSTHSSPMPLPPSQDDFLTALLSKTFFTLIHLGQPYFACWKYLLGPPTSADPSPCRLQTSKCMNKGQLQRQVEYLQWEEKCAKKDRSWPSSKLTCSGLKMFTGRDGERQGSSQERCRAP